jgi:hypothetical protein
MLIAKVNGTAVESFSFYGTNSSTAGVSISAADSQFLSSIFSLPVVSELPYDFATQKLESVDPYVENGYVYTVKVTTA